MARKLTTDLAYPDLLVDNLPTRAKPKGEVECSICLNDGWVMLRGTTREGQGATYDVGCTACRWCKVGYRLFHVEKAQGNDLLEEYDLADIDSPVPPINWRDAAERLKAEAAMKEGIAALKKLTSAQSTRGRELEHGGTSPSGTLLGPRPFAPVPSAASDTVDATATPQSKEDE